MIKKSVQYEGHDIFLIPSKEDTYLLYAPTLCKLLRVNLQMAEILSKDELSLEHQNSGVRKLVEILFKALESAIMPFNVSQGKSRYFHLALGLTKRCTLRCVYCHAEAGDEDDMSPDLIEDAILHSFRSAAEKGLKGVNISFAVGGEPTANFPLLVACVDQVERLNREFNLKCNLSMTTNGYYPLEIARYISEHINNILLSFDGPKDIQDLHRPTTSGDSGYDVVLQSAKYFCSNAKSFSIRSTVSNFSVSRMPEIVEFFHGALGSSYHLVFEPLVPLGRAAVEHGVIKEPSKRSFVNYYIKAKEEGARRGVEVRTSAANHKRLVTSFCGAMSMPSFTVTTKGVITTCDRDSDGKMYAYGHYLKGEKRFELDANRIERNRQLLTFPPKCNMCFCKWHCAGDCPDVRSVNYERCSVNRALIRYELENALDSLGKK